MNRFGKSESRTQFTGLHKRRIVVSIVVLCCNNGKLHAIMQSYFNFVSVVKTNSLIGFLIYESEIFSGVSEIWLHFRLIINFFFNFVKTFGREFSLVTFLSQLVTAGC